MSGRLLALALALVAVAGLAAPVTAQDVTFTSVETPDSVAQGDQFTVDVTVSRSGSAVSDVTAALTLPDGVSCSSSGGQTVTFSGDTGLASFACSADAVGDYRGEISVSVTGQDDQGNALSESTQTGTRVLAPASLTLSTTVGEDTVDEGDRTDLTAVLHNAGDVAADYDLSTEADGVSLSAESGATTGTLQGGETVTVVYAVTGESAGTHAVAVNASATNGQSLGELEEIAVESSGGGGSGGSSSTGSTSSPSVEVTDASVAAGADAPGETVTVEATVENDGDVAGTTTLELTADGEAVAARSVEVADGDTRTVTLGYAVDQPGTYTLAVGGIEAGTVVVEQATTPSPTPDATATPEPTPSATAATTRTDASTPEDRAAGTSTPTGTETAVPPDTATAEPADGEATDTVAETTTESGPGFTAVTALVAVTLAVLARRRQ